VKCRPIGSRAERVGTIGKRVGKRGSSGAANGVASRNGGKVTKSPLRKMYCNKGGTTDTGFAGDHGDSWGKPRSTEVK